MKAARLCLFIFLLSFTEKTTAQHDACPSWFISQAYNSSSAICYCNNSLTGVKCFPILQFGFCVTYNSSTEIVELGPCPYVSRYNTTSTTIIDYKVFYILPDNASLLNKFMCGPLNREGPLCGKCKDKYAVALYSYTLECSKCWGHGYGWALYYFLELFPTTVMYFLVVIFHIRATSSPLSALVFMSQIVVYTIRLNVPWHMYIENNVTGFLYIALQVLLVLCGIWSLDFFRSVIPAFCVSSSIKTVHALALEYLMAFYSIFLILITYACIKLHDNNFRPVVWLWKPFHRYFVHFRRTWDSKASIINAFTTFLLLSFSKVLFVSFTLLYYFHTAYFGSRKCLLYYDPTVECNTQEFAIFAAIAGCVLVIFVILPTLLLIVYPTRLFRRCVSCCGFRRWHALHMFVESFQGQYKDGTNGTRDFRMVSASFLIIRILIIFTFLNRNYHTWSLSYQIALFASVTCIYAIIKPYKFNYMTTVDILILFLAEMLSLATTNSKTKHFTKLILASTLVLLVPHMVLLFYICYELAKKASITEYLQRKYKLLKKYVQDTRCKSQIDVEAESDTGSLPDRLINPEEYEPVILTKEHVGDESTRNRDLVNEQTRWRTPVYTYGSIK